MAAFNADWAPILFPLFVFLYIYLLYRVEKRFHQQRTLTDEEFLAYLARVYTCSEYDLFHAAAEEWNLSGAGIDEDFKDYLKEGNMPYYVKDFIRKARKEAGEG